MDYTFSKESIQKLNLLSDFMLEYNKELNLTRITQPGEVWEKHFIDSILPLSLFNVPRGTKIIDVGTGAGFPGVVLKIEREDLDLTLLDSLNKKIKYLDELKKELGMEYRTLHGRSEEISHNPIHREKYDIAISRAVANLSSLLELTLPLVKINGYFIAMKGSRDESGGINKALKVLGGELQEKISYNLPSGDERNLLIFKKITNTPTKYPRKRLNISKNPLI